MKLSANHVERRLQISGILLILGLLTESLCLLWVKPLSFLALLSLGGTLLFLGISTYLLAVLAIRHPQE